MGKNKKNSNHTDLQKMIIQRKQQHNKSNALHPNHNRGDSMKRGFVNQRGGTTQRRVIGQYDHRYNHVNEWRQNARDHFKSVPSDSLQTEKKQNILKRKNDHQQNNHNNPPNKKRRI